MPSIKAAPNAPAVPQNLEALRDRFLLVRNRTERLAAPLAAETCNLQSMPDASPTKWHLAHTTWFFETFLLEPHQKNFQPFHPNFRVLFNSYYNGVGDKHPRHERGLIGTPDLETILAYRHHVSKAIVEMMAGLGGKSGGPNAEWVALAWLGCHHEEQHQELILTDLKHLLSKNPLQPVYQKLWPLTPIEARALRWFRYEGGLIEIGHGGSEFAFDNEGPRHHTYLRSFELASHPVTHGEFAAFVADGGYQRPELWLSLGWDWVQANRITAPMYWQRDDKANIWTTFTLHGRAEIDHHTPMCHVNYFEADAYARWADARLPTEAEWEHAAAGADTPGNFLESGALHPLALREEQGDHPSQLYGDVWEWTGSAYLPYPGYKPAAGAVGEYNGKFMCNQFVLRGGSCATPQNHIRATYRNFFPPDARWQFSGFRLARDV